MDRNARDTYTTAAAGDWTLPVILILLLVLGIALRLGAGG